MPFFILKDGKGDLIFKNTGLLFIFSKNKKEGSRMQANPIQKRWGEILEKYVIESGIEYYKCKHNEGYVIDVQKLPEAKGQFLTVDGKYIVPSSDWKQLIKLNPSFAPVVYHNQAAVKKLFKNFDDFIRRI